MKILQINSVAGIGSTGRIATRIDSVLKSQGHESYLAYGRDSQNVSTPSIRIGSNFDVYQHIAMTRIFDKHGFSSKKTTKNFIKEIIEIDPDVIHLHNIHGYYINVEILFDYLKKSKTPVVWTLHDSWAFTGHCSHFEYSGCECWQGKTKCIQKKSYPKSLIFNNSLQNYQRKKAAFTGVENLTIVTPSNWLAKLVKESHLKEYPVQVINNGIDLTVFKPTKSTFREENKLTDKYLILGVANVWGKKKGFDHFIELSKRLKQDEVIVLVGLSEKQKSELPSNIIGITQTNHVAELVDIYSSADVYVNLTLEDTFPTTNLEALACGTPVITFKTGGSVESIDENCGYIVEQEDMNDLRDKLTQVKAKGKDSYISNAVSKAERHYSDIDRFQDYIDLYENLLNK